MKDCELIREFRSYLKSEKHASDYTSKCYGIDLEQFRDFLISHNTETVDGSEAFYSSDKAVATETKAETKVAQLLLEVDVNTVGAFLAYLNDNRYSKTTICRKLAALRSFYKFLIKQNRLDSNPAMVIKAPKMEKKPPKFLDNEQVQLLLNTPPADNWLGVRDRAILEILYNTGMRISEVVALNISDINFLAEVIHIRNKGKKQRVVPIASSALRSLQYYIEFRNKLTQNSASIDNGDLFLNRYAEPLGARSIRRRMDKYLKIAGMDPSSSPHTLRHSFAANLLNKGAGLHRVRELLGHQSLSTTQVYAQLATKNIL